MLETLCGETVKVLLLICLFISLLPI